MDATTILAEISPREAVARLAADITAMTTRINHHGKLAWTVARGVAPDLAADQQRVWQDLQAMRGDRRAITRCLSDAVTPWRELRAALRDGDTLRMHATRLVQDGRGRVEHLEGQGTVESVEAATVLADAVKVLTVPLIDFETALADAATRRTVIETALTRRVHSCLIVTRTSRVETITAQLQRLQAEVHRIHEQALQPDPIDAAVRQAAELVELGHLPIPTIVWPKWGTISNSKPSSKAAWIGDPFAPPTLGDPT